MMTRPGRTLERSLSMHRRALELVPVLVVFFAGQRYIVRGIVMMGIAGR